MTIGSVFYVNADNLRHVEQSYHEVETVRNEKIDQNFVDKMLKGANLTMLVHKPVG